MKLGYYGYSLIDQDGNEFLIDIRGLINNFCNYKDVKFKNQFMHEDGNMFLVNRGSGFFYLPLDQKK